MSTGLPVRFGTSSWAYEGWRDEIYHRPYSASRFSRDSLAEYAAYPSGGAPLFRTVIDHTSTGQLPTPNSRITQARCPPISTSAPRCGRN